MPPPPRLLSLRFDRDPGPTLVARWGELRHVICFPVDSIFNISCYLSPQLVWPLLPVADAVCTSLPFTDRSASWNRNVSAYFYARFAVCKLCIAQHSLCLCKCVAMCGIRFKTSALALYASAEIVGQQKLRPNLDIQRIFHFACIS